jgi:hypothetical protein
MSGKTWLWMTVTAATLTGCHHNNPPSPNRADAFASDPAVPSVQQIVTAQTATGARDDGTLRSMHFDGGQLNSLGRQKLDLMARDEDASSRILVYLDLPTDAPVKRARGAVTDFLKSLGVADAQIQIEDGPNPSATAPASKSIADQQRLSDDKKDSKDNGTGYQSSAPPMSNGLKDLANH